MKMSCQRLAMFTLLGLAAGCSSKSPTESTVSKTPAAQVAQTEAPLITGKAVHSLTPASETVTLFLESWKTGNAGQTRALLTSAAQAEIERRGLSIEPIGLSTFQIGQTRYLDNDEDAAYVESQLSELNEDGSTLNTDIVFTVHLEEQNWRISGMAIDMGAELPPAIVDFEDMSANLPRETAPAADALNASSTAFQQVPPATNNFQQGAPSDSGFNVPTQLAQPPANSYSPTR